MTHDITYTAVDVLLHARSFAPTWDDARIWRALALNDRRFFGNTGDLFSDEDLKRAETIIKESYR